METERTEIDDITFEVRELRRIDLDRGDVASIVAVVDPPDGDLGSPVDMTEPAGLGILPLGADFGEEALKNGVVSFQVVQGGLLAFQGRAGLPAQLQRQLLHLS